MTAAPTLTREQIEGMPAGRAMDALVAERLGLPLAPPCPTMHTTDEAQYDSHYGWGGWCYTCQKLIDEVPAEAEPYSTDFGSAFPVLRAIAKNGWLYTINGGCSSRGASVHLLRVSGPLYEYETASADTVELAICRAVLLTTLETE